MAYKIIDKDGTEYKSKKALCEAHNLKCESVYSYSRNHSISFLDAVYALEILFNDNKIIDKNGIEYKSKKALCKAHNIDYNKAVEHARRHSISWLDAVYALEALHTKRIIIDIDGTIYKSKQAICKIYNVDHHSVDRYMQKNSVSYIDALHTLSEIYKNKEKYIDDDGTEYASKQTLCEKYHISLNTVNKYMTNHSTSFINALHILHEKNKNKKIIDINGTEYKSQPAICDAYNININSVRNYMQKHSVSFIKALHAVNEIYKNKEKYIDIDGTRYPTQKAACKKYNIHENRVRNYMKKHSASFMEALHALNEICENKEKYIDINGIEYKSLKALFDKYNISYKGAFKIIHSYVKNYHMSYLEALYCFKNFKKNFTFNNIKIIKHIHKSPYYLIETNDIQSIISPKALASKYIAYLIKKQEVDTIE